MMISGKQANTLAKNVRELAIFTIPCDEECLSWLIAAKAGRGYTDVDVAIEDPNSKEKAAYLVEYLSNYGYKTKLKEYSWLNLWGLKISWNND